MVMSEEDVVANVEDALTSMSVMASAGRDECT
jgi:hypothetical protein